MHRRFAIVVFYLLCTLLVAPRLSHAVQVTGSNIIDGQWVDADAKVRIDLDDLSGADEIRVFVGSTDLTALFKREGNELVFQPGVIDLPNGEGEIKLYTVSNDQWQEAGSVQIRVRKVAGFDRFEITPTLNLTVKAQFREGHSPDAGPPVRSTFHDLTGQGGLGLDLARGDFSMQVQSNFIGTSHRDEALRFGQKGNHAPKVDLSDYLVTLNKGAARLSIGHDQFQGGRYILGNAMNRGINASYSFGDRVSLAATAQSTTAIVGYDNAVGLKKADNRIFGAKISAEVFERPGALKVEGLVSQGSQLSDPGFNIGEINDAEHSRTMALRASASTPESMFTAEFEAARSRYRNTNDPSLNQGLGVVPVNETNDSALFGRLVFNAYQGQFKSGKPLSLSLAYEYERIAPLYKTVGQSGGSLPLADLMRHLVSANTTLGDATVSVSLQEMHDNLDNIPTILTTKTRQLLSNASIPLKSMLAGDATGGVFPLFLPNLNANYTLVHQFGDNRPDLNPLSGFSPGHIPDQMTKTLELAANWSGDIWSLSYIHNRSRQDNRQLGRANSDFVNVLHGVNGELRIFDQLTLTAGISRNSARDIEQAISNYTLSRNIGLNWILFENWTISGILETSRNSDSQQNANARSLSANAQVAWQYEIPGYHGRKIPGQAYLRYDRQINDSIDNLFAFRSNVTNWTVQAGFSLSMF